ncbi:Dps family protein [Streptomyces sp. CO7]
MTTIKSTLSDAARKTAGDALQNTLTDLLALALVGKQAHWNTVGPHFRSVHLQLDELVADARVMADAVAERAATIGVPPDGRPQTIASTLTLPTPDHGWIPDTETTALVVNALDTATTRLREHIDTLDDTDAVTQDLLVSTTAELEKHRWMFAATTAQHG